MREKQTLRNKARALRDNLSPAERDIQGRRLTDALFSLNAYAVATAVATYVSIGSELPTDPIIRRALQDGKKVFCPKVLDVKTSEMDFYEIADRLSLVPSGGTPSIPEPDGNAMSLSAYLKVTSALLDARILFLVPGLAFDRKGTRLGYGGGFYDRYLLQFETSPGRDSGSRMQILALAFDCQIFDGPLPFTQGDVRVPAILTPQGMIDCSPGHTPD